MFGCLLSIACTMLISSAVAQEAPQPQVITLEHRAGGHLSLDASINGQKGTFIFDSGLGTNSVTSKMASRIGCKPWGRVTGFRAIGEKISYPRCQPTKIMINDSAFDLSTVSLIDLAAFMPPGSPDYVGAIGLDAFRGKTITIRSKAAQIIVETPASLARRVPRATPIPIRYVQGNSDGFTVNVGVPTASGVLWMELDTGNLGMTMIDAHAAPLVGLDAMKPDGQVARIPIARDIMLTGPVQVLNLIMDGNVGADFLRRWDLTLDLSAARGWLTPAAQDPA